MTSSAAAPPVSTSTSPTLVLTTLASAQFLMTLDSSVMNVSIAQVAEDLGTTVTGVQTAITLYTLVMATAMITGGKLGSMWGRRRAFSLGCVVYGAGSLTTALAPNLTVLIIGWSVLEGLGAALIMPAIVALVATNFPAEKRPQAYGLVASAGAIAVAAGPLVGGAVTTFWTWRLVFAGEVVIVALILASARKVRDDQPRVHERLDVVGIVLSSLGLGLAVFGVLRSGEWGWVRPRPDTPSLLGLSGTVWLVLTGLLVIRAFFVWEEHRVRRGLPALVRTSMLQDRQLAGGLTMFFFQFLLQAGLFFTIPLYLSVALGLSALDTGIRLLPLSVTLLISAVGVPRVWPQASPRRVVSWGLAALLAGILALVGALELGSGPEIVTVPLLLAGTGVGCLASQLGAVTVSSMPDELSGEVGGLQNTSTNLGASLGTALAGSVLIAALSASFLAGIASNPDVPQDVVDTAQVELTGSVPFVSDDALASALEETDLSQTTVDAIIENNAEARIDGLRLSLLVLALVAVLALFLTRLVPDRPVGGERSPGTGEVRPLSSS